MFNNPANGVHDFFRDATPCRYLSETKVEHQPPICFRSICLRRHFCCNLVGPKSAKTIPWHEVSLAKDVRNFASNSRTSTTGSPMHRSPARARSSQSFLAKSTLHRSSITTMGSFFLQAEQNANTRRRIRAWVLEVLIKPNPCDFRYMAPPTTRRSTCVQRGYRWAEIPGDPLQRLEPSQTKKAESLMAG